MLDLKFNLLDLLTAVIVYQGLAFAVYLFFKGLLAQRANLFLFLFCVALAFNFFFILLMSTGILSYNNNPGLFFGLLYGPLIYMYARALVEPKARFAVRQILHFLPSLLVLLALGISKFDMLTYMVYATFLAFTHLTLYIVFSYKVIRAFKRGVNQALSKTEEADLSWLYQLLFSMILLFSIVGLESLVQVYLSAFWDNVSIFLVLLSVIGFVNILFFKGTRFSTAFKGLSEESKEVISNVNKKYLGSVIAEEQAVAWLRDLDSAMRENQYYLKEEITINELADAMGMTPRILSQLINQFLNKNYYDFINAYRVDHAVELLSNDSDMRINEVMYASGFSSKSTFNQVFKNKIGKTPTEYRASLIRT